MSRRPPNIIKRLKWRLEWLSQVVAEFLVARLPAVVAFRGGEILGGLLWHLMRQRRRIVHKNLRIVLAGEQSSEEIDQLARKSFIRSIANLVSAVHSAHLPMRVLESRVTVENPELLEAAVREGQGCLLLPPHMGNWELLSRIKHHFPEGHPLGALYRPLNNPHLDARLTEKRRSEGTRMFSKRDSLLEITRFLKDGGIIGVLADQRAGWQGLHANFFGRLTRSSPLPHLLIRRCKIPAFAISVRTVRPGHWALRYHPVDAPGDTQACMDAIERAMRESLVDVFWFQERWKCYISREQSLREWLGAPEHRSARSRHRVLIWLVGASDGWRLPDEWLHPDVDYEVVVQENQPPPNWPERITRVHQIAPGGGRAEIHKCLSDIDKADALPLDFVASTTADDALRAACRREGVNFVSIQTP
jgi:KDO2-lipid IV(A) lauroyltransferase